LITRLNDPNQIGAVGEVAVMQHQAGIYLMGILVKVVDPIGVETAGPAFNAVHFIALLQKQLRQVTAVLAGDSSDECSFGGDGGA
jgi:hypothetical protein